MLLKLLYKYMLPMFLAPERYYYDNCYSNYYNIKHNSGNFWIYPTAFADTFLYSPVSHAGAILANELVVENGVYLVLKPSRNHLVLNKKNKKSGKTHLTACFVYTE